MIPRAGAKMDRPGERRRFYNSTHWRKARLLQLARCPLCEDCRRIGLLRAATCVDHIIGLANGGAPLDPSNLSSLCDSCHSRRTVTKDRGFGMKPAKEKPRKGCGVDGRPIDSMHPWFRGNGTP